MESVQELKREELDRVECKNGDKEKGADHEMRIKSYRDFKSQSKIKFLSPSFVIWSKLLRSSWSASQKTWVYLGRCFVEI